MSVEAIARRTLDLPEDSEEIIPQHYLDEVAAILKNNPHDTEFKVKRAPGAGFGVAVCQETTCGKKQFVLTGNQNVADGGKTFGVGSLEDLLHHQKESPKHYKGRKARLAAQDVVDTSSLPPCMVAAKKTGSSSKSTSRAPTAPVSANNSFLVGNSSGSGNNSRSSSGSSKRKSDVITIDDSDDDDIQVISSRPAEKKAKLPESKGRDVKPTFFPSSPGVERKPLVKTTSHGSNGSQNRSFSDIMREDKKPIFVSSSSPGEQKPINPAYQAIKPPQNDSGFSSSPSGRQRSAEEDKIWKEMRKKQEACRQLRNESRANPDDRALGDAVLRKEEELDALQEEMDRVKAGKRREPSTEDDDLPDVRMVASKDGPKPNLAAFARVGGEPGPSSRPAAPLFAPRAAAPLFAQPQQALGNPNAAPRIENGLPPMFPGINFADNFPAGPQALAQQNQALIAHQQRMALQQQQLALLRQRQALLAQRAVPQPKAEDAKPGQPAHVSSSEDEAGPSAQVPVPGFADPAIIDNDPRLAGSRLANFFSDAVSGHDFDAEGEKAIEKALDALKLKDLKSKLPNTAINLYPHQCLGAAWMLNQEKSKYKGGLLADEMGLGKTVQAISCITLNQAAADDKKEKTTLILAPLALLEQWKDEIETKTEKRLSCLIYHGAKKPTSKNEIRRHDVVLTTPGTLLTQWVPCDTTALAQAKKKHKDNGDEWGSGDEADWYDSVEQTGVLFRITWRRVVIDEAQVIRAKGTKAARAVCHLKATYRWALSGTPMVNELSDYYSLVRFLRVPQWLDWSEWNYHIKKLEKRRPADAAKRAQVILSKIMLRRNKESSINGVKLITLPAKHKNDVFIELTEEERNLYQVIELKAQEKFSRYLREGSVMRNYAHIFSMLLRLRMLCGHPALVQEDILAAALEDPDEDRRIELEKATKALGKAWIDKLQKKRLDAAVDRANTKEGEEAEIEECQICYEPLDSDTSMVTNCMHIFCSACLNAVMDDEARQLVEEGAQPGDRPCPTCRTPIKKATNYKLKPFEPTKQEIAKITGQMEEDDDFEEEIAAYLEKKTGYESPKRCRVQKKTIKFDSDEEDELASSPQPKARKPISKAAKKRIIKDSDDDYQDGNNTEDDEDFIDDDGVAEKHRAKGYTKGTGAKEDSEIDSDSEAIEDNDSEEEKPKKSDKKGKGRAKRPSASMLSKFSSKTLIPSTKLQAMLKIIMEAPEDDRFLVISQWTTMLDLVAIYLDERKVPIVRYQGSMTRDEKDRAVKQFNGKTMKKAMLMSLKAGGVGLNLVGGNRVINLDLAWSPSVENQAFDRVHRLGQRKEVHITRIIVADTVDSRLQAIQERKQLLADSSLGEGTGKKLGKIGVRELQALFGL